MLIKYATTSTARKELSLLFDVNKVSNRAAYKLNICLTAAVTTNKLTILPAMFYVKCMCFYVVCKAPNGNHLDHSTISKRYL